MSRFNNNKPNAVVQAAIDTLDGLASWENHKDLLDELNRVHCSKRKLRKVMGIKAPMTRKAELKHFKALRKMVNDEHTKNVVRRDGYIRGVKNPKNLSKRDTVRYVLASAARAIKAQAAEKPVRKLTLPVREGE